MKKRWFATMGTILVSMTALFVLLEFMKSTTPAVANPALAAPLEVNIPTVTGISPDSSPNDLDTPIIITGADFTSVPTVTLGSTLLDVVGWVSSTTLTATVPWGLDAGVYTLTVTNPDGGKGSLPNAFTVTQGIGVWTTGGPYGGDILGLVLNPATPTTVYALAHNAGVFASYNAAETWQPILLDATPNLLVFDAEDPQVMYFGSGRLMRTKDGGSTWESVSVGNGSYYPAAHPKTPGVVYVAVSCFPSAPPDFDCGVYRSVNYGSTWVTKSNGLTDTHPMAIAFHPENPNKMLVGTRDGNVFLSTDGGDNWNWKAKVSGSVPPAMPRLYFNPSGAHEAWATTGANEPPHYLYKSEHPELEVWTPVSVAGGNNVNSLTFLSDTIWSAGAEGFTSTNGGASWSPVSTAGPLTERTGDTKAFAIDPGNPDVIYASNTGQGIFKSSDGGATWSVMNQGLAAVVPNVLAVTPTDIDTVYADTYALGVLKSSNGGHAWRLLGIGETKFNPLAVDPVTPTRVYMGDDSSGFIQLQISEDAGDTWHEVTATLPVAWSGWRTDIRKVAPHPNISGTILAGVSVLMPGAIGGVGMERGAIYASDDYGEHWENAGPTQPISEVRDLAYDAVDPNLVYAATYGTGLWKSVDGGASWGKVTSFPGGPIIRSVVTHPDVPDTVYARCDYSEQPTYVSRDAGKEWEQLPPCDNCGGRLLFAPPGRGKPSYTLYAGPGAPNGLHSSTDGGYTWKQVEGVPTTDIYSLAAGSDHERVVLYVGISGGVISPQSQAAAVADVISGQGEIMPAGVYRMTTRLPTDWVYLPLVVRGYAP